MKMNTLDQTSDGLVATQMKDIHAHWGRQVRDNVARTLNAYRLRKRTPGPAVAVEATVGLVTRVHYQTELVAERLHPASQNDR